MTLLVVFTYDCVALLPGNLSVWRYDSLQNAILPISYADIIFVKFLNKYLALCADHHYTPSLSEKLEVTGII